MTKASKSQLRNGSSEFLEKRTSMRFLDDVRDVELQVAYCAKVCDESRGGIGVMLQEDPHLVPGQRVSINYKGGSMDSEVRWSCPSGDGRHRLGLKWI